MKKAQTLHNTVPGVKGAVSSQVRTAAGPIHYKLEFLDTVVAQGSIAGDAAHEARFKITATHGGTRSQKLTAAGATPIIGTTPVVGIRVPIPQITAGGRGPFAIRTAKVILTSPTTNARGEAFGKLLSGQREEVTQVQIPIPVTKRQAEEATAEATASVEQVWNGLLDGNGPGRQWSYPEEFVFDLPVSLTYRMAYQRQGQWIPIPRHRMEIVTDALVGEEWVPNAGPDEDKDGVPDGIYVLRTYNRGEPGFHGAVKKSTKAQDKSTMKRSDLITRRPALVRSATGSYTTQQTIEFNSYFVVDGVNFSANDNDAFGAEGNTGP